MKKSAEVKTKTLHLIDGGAVACGRSGVDANERLSDVTCKKCLSVLAARPAVDTVTLTEALAAGGVEVYWPNVGEAYLRPSDADSDVKARSVRGEALEALAELFDSGWLVMADANEGRGDELYRVDPAKAEEFGNMIARPQGTVAPPADEPEVVTPAFDEKVLGRYVSAAFGELTLHCMSDDFVLMWVDAARSHFFDNHAEQGVPVDAAGEILGGPVEPADLEDALALLKAAKPENFEPAPKLEPAPKVEKVEKVKKAAGPVAGTRQQKLWDTYSIAAAVRWMGFKGFTEKEAKAALASFGIETEGKNIVRSSLGAGRPNSPRFDHSAIPALSENETAELLAFKGAAASAAA